MPPAVIQELFTRGENRALVDQRLEALRVVAMIPEETQVLSCEI